MRIDDVVLDCDSSSPATCNYVATILGDL